MITENEHTQGEWFELDREELANHKAILLKALKAISAEVEKCCPIGSDPTLYNLLVDFGKAKEAIKKATE